MGDQDKHVAQHNQGGEKQVNGLTPHQQAILDYANTAAMAANRAQTEEISARTQHIVKTEIHSSFEQYSKMTTSRRVLMAVGAVLAFGAGFLVKGTLMSKKKEEPNGVGDH